MRRRIRRLVRWRVFNNDRTATRNLDLPLAIGDSSLPSSSYCIVRFWPVHGGHSGGLFLPPAGPPAGFWSRLGPEATIGQFVCCKERRVAMRQTTDLDFLLYPLATEEMPKCPECGAPMTFAVLEAREDSPDFSTFRCAACQRSERFVIEDAP